MSVARREAARDQVESGFTPILRQLLSADPDLLIAVFVDRDGECIDYASVLPPFDAKVVGAHFLVLIDDVRTRFTRMGLGETSAIDVSGAARRAVAWRIDEEYLLVVVANEAIDVARLELAMMRAVRELRAEAGLDTPAWDPIGEGVEVFVRAAVGWEFAPTAFQHSGRRTEVVAVLGRWEEAGDGLSGALVCFRVQVAAGGEVTLAFDPEQGRWFVW